MREDVNWILIMVFFLFCSMMCNSSNDALRNDIKASKTSIDALSTKQDETTRAIQAQTRAIEELTHTLKARDEAR